VPINCGWLLVLEVLVAATAVDRLITGTPQVDGLPVLIVSGIAALVMTGGALILRGNGDGNEAEADEHDLSVAAVLLDTVADAAAAAGVAATGCDRPGNGRLVLARPAVALAIALVVTYHAFALIRKSSSGSDTRQRTMQARRYALIKGEPVVFGGDLNAERRRRRPTVIVTKRDCR
jgi:cobalt-zinc-cadmium efflux system protein